MKPKTWVVGGHGLVGEALKELLEHEKNVHFLSRQEFDIKSPHLQIPFQSGDTVIDLVPSPYPRTLSAITSEDYHSAHSHKHASFMTSSMKAGIKRYIFLSSGGTVYGKSLDKKPFSEDDQLKPISLYGESKKILEEHLRANAPLHNVEFMILRPSNIFNENPFSSLSTGLINILRQKFLLDQEIDIFGDLDIRKDYISHKDVARAVVLSISKGKNDIFNIGQGKTYSIAEILSAFEKRFQKKLPLKFHPENPEDVTWFSLKKEKSLNVLGFSPKQDLIDWINTIPLS